MLHDAAEDGLSLTVGIARVDEFVDVVPGCEGDEFAVALVGAFLMADGPFPRGRRDGKRLHTPMRVGPHLALVCVGHGEAHKMPLGPGDQDPARRDVSVMAFGVAQRLADGLRDGMLLCDDEPHVPTPLVPMAVLLGTYERRGSVRHISPGPACGPSDHSF